MSARTLLRLLLGALTAALALSPLAVPTAAHAGQVGVTISITGAGRVEVVEGTIEDGGSLACDRTTNLDHRVTMTCPRIRNEEAFEAWVWLRPSLFGTPPGWEFVEWQGCDQLRTGTGGVKECAVHSGAFTTVEKAPNAIFRDTVVPTVNSLTFSQVLDEQGRIRFNWLTHGAVRSQCRLDGGAWDVCASPHTLTLAEGSHVFAVRSEDLSGNLSLTHSLQVYAVDTSLTTQPPRLSNKREASFTFASGAGDAFNCTIDAFEFPCDNGAANFTGLADGTHTFSVAAHRGVWLDQVPVRWTWTVDATAPETTLTGGPTPGSTTTSSVATFTLDSADAVAFQCTLDAAPTPCEQGVVRLEGLAPGSHVFEAAGRDEAGNLDASPATRRWTVTTVQPNPGPGPGAGPGPVADAPVTTVAPAAALKRGKGWSLKKSPSGPVATSTRRGAVATLAVSGVRRIALVTSGGPKDGKVKVYAGKRLLRTVSLRSPDRTAGRVIQVGDLPAAWSGTLRIVVATAGKPVRIEGVATTTW